MRIYLVDQMKKTPEKTIDIPDNERVLVGRGGASKVRLDLENETIGEDSDSLSGLLSYISREHCILYLDSSQPYVVDGNGKRPSQNGTFVDGEPVTSSLGTILEDRSILKLGPYGFQVFYNPKSSRGSNDPLTNLTDASETVPLDYKPQNILSEEGKK